MDSGWGYRRVVKNEASDPRTAIHQIATNIPPGTRKGHVHCFGLEGCFLTWSVRRRTCAMTYLGEPDVSVKDGLAVEFGVVLQP